MRFIELFETTQAFRLAPGLNPSDFQISNSMRDLDHWKAKVFDGNSAGEDVKIGDMEKVGYVMISIKDNTIVPIARSDEHHMGSDTMWNHMERRKVDINPDDYLPIFNGNNYVYYTDEIPDLLIAVKKWLSYGGPDVILKGSNNLSGKAMTFKQFAARDGNVDITPGELAPMGEAFLTSLSELAAALQASRQDPHSRANLGKIKRIGSAIISGIGANSYMFINLGKWADGLDKLIKEWKEEISSFEGSQTPVQDIEYLFFGFHGIKNAMHQRLRDVMTGKDLYISYKRDVSAFWGDLELAYNMLAKF